MAVLDSDDLMHPRRLERLIDEAERERADIIAGRWLLVFYEAGDRPPHRHVRGRLARASSWVDPGDYVESNAIYARTVCLGYLKPVFRRAALEAAGLRYDETLTIGEDSNFVARCLAAGLRFRISPFPYYLYRRHDGSLSHVLAIRDIGSLLTASQNDGAAVAGPLRARYRRYCASLRRALAFGRAVDAIKAGRIGEALALAARNPGVIPLFWMPVAARLGRLRPHPRPAAADPKAICVLSRQRLIGATNGSSAYLIALCRGLRTAGYRPHLLQPSPAVFGRWPILRLKPEMDVFETVRLRGGLRLGRFLIAADPRVILAATRYLVSRVLQQAKLPYAFLGAAPATYAIAAAWTPDDLVFVARHATLVSAALVADYAFQNEVSVYALRPHPTFVVMHDLFHARAGRFEAAAAVDSVATLAADAEMRLLDIADVVVAIQDDEAAEVRRQLPRKRVIVAPMGVEAVASAQPGASAELLFVGGANAANVAGLEWFLAAAWPLIKAAVPHATLTVAGSVGRAFAQAPGGVTFVGVLPSLDAAYARAAVVISPLTAGSGLKVKLVEALAHGKAVVATPVTLQGVEALARDAVAVAATPEAFADEVTALLGDPARRATLGQRGLELARRAFSPDAASAPLVEALAAALAG